MTRSDGPARLRHLIKRPGIIKSLGAHDVFSALIMEQAGFEVVFLGGFGASASMLGLPDLNFLSMPEMAQAVERTCSRLSIPVIADADTGHGDLPHIQRTVKMFEQAGAAGLLLEDQVMPKRCGHFARKQVVSQDEMVERIRAAVNARRNPDFVIIARTDSRQVHGIDDAIERVNRCCEAGADVAFVEAPQSEAELKLVAEKVKFPLFANMLTGGVTPILPASRLEKMGYKFVVAPVESLMVCAAALKDLCKAWKEGERIDQLAGKVSSFSELKEILGLEECLTVRERLEGSAAERSETKL
ncbi:MAG: isocitrate lyase/PEP mutase family protein [Verrucomicrobiales bacterium]